MNKIKKTVNGITKSLQVTKDFTNPQTTGNFDSTNLKNFLQKNYFRYGHPFSNLYIHDGINQLGGSLFFDYFKLYRLNCDWSNHNG